MLRRIQVRPVMATLLVAMVLAGCSGDPDPADSGEEADGTAAALVEGLAAGNLGDVPLVDGTGSEATADLEQVVEGMGERDPEVELTEVTEDGAQATATLTWSWPLLEGQEAWTYDSRVELRRADGQWAVVWAHDVVEPSLTAASVLDLTPVTARRGTIVGAGGERLVTDRPVVRVGIDRAQVPKRRAGASARALAGLAGVEPGPFAERVTAAGDRAFVEAITFRVTDVPPELARGYEQVRGARLIRDTMPLAPTRDFAAPILGSVGEVTGEMVEEEPEKYDVGDVAGTSGLQARYDDRLRGAAGVVVDAVASDGKEREIHRVQAEPGEPLRLTLDRRLQSAAEDVLSDVGPASALVAVRPSDGAILAAANGPGNGGANLATYGRYPPGSTFKAVSSLALLRRGLSPEDTVACPPTVDVDGRDFENYDGYPSSGLGQIPFRTALANSCNTAFIGERTRLRPDDLAEAAASLGMGIDHDLGFPAYFGSVTPPTTETGSAADMIGQGTILASPMTMATVMASVQQGRTVVPRLLEKVEVSVPDQAPPLTREEADTLRGMLRGVVTSGSGSLLADVPGPPVIAKTGTAEFQADDGGTRTHAWMVAARGDLAVAVFVAEGDSGSGTAGPLLERFLRAAG